MWTSLRFVTSGPISAMDAHLLRQLLALVCKHLCAVLSAVLSCSVVPESLQPHGLFPARLLCPWDSLGKNAGVGCHFLLQGIFPTQESNPGLLYCRQILYWLSYEGSHELSIATFEEFSKKGVCSRYSILNASAVDGASSPTFTCAIGRKGNHG